LLEPIFRCRVSAVVSSILSSRHPLLVGAISLAFAHALTSPRPLCVSVGKRRVELERNFREQLAATKLLSDVSPVGISRWDAEGKIVCTSTSRRSASSLLFSIQHGMLTLFRLVCSIDVNDSWYQQSGHPHDKPLDSWLESVHPDFHDRLREIYHELFTNKTPGMDWEWMWSNGTWSFCQAMIVSEASSSLVGTICVLTEYDPVLFALPLISCVGADNSISWQCYRSKTSGSRKEERR
jgi:hypothetical protein